MQSKMMSRRRHLRRADGERSPLQEGRAPRQARSTSSTSASRTGTSTESSSESSRTREIWECVTSAAAENDVAHARERSHAVERDAGGRESLVDERVERVVGDAAAPEPRGARGRRARRASRRRRGRRRAHPDPRRACRWPPRRWPPKGDRRMLTFLGRRVGRRALDAPRRPTRRRRRRRSRRRSVAARIALPTISSSVPGDLAEKRRALAVDVERRAHRDERLEEGAAGRRVVRETHPRRRAVMDADPVAPEEMRQGADPGQGAQERADRSIDDSLLVARR